MLQIDIKNSTTKKTLNICSKIGKTALVNTNINNKSTQYGWVGSYSQNKYQKKTPFNATQKQKLCTQVPLLLQSPKIGALKNRRTRWNTSSKRHLICSIIICPIQAMMHCYCKSRYSLLFSSLMLFLLISSRSWWAVSLSTREALNKL